MKSIIALLVIFIFTSCTSSQKNHNTHFDMLGNSSRQLASANACIEFFKDNFKFWEKDNDYKDRSADSGKSGYIVNPLGFKDIPPPSAHMLHLEANNFIRTELEGKMSTAAARRLRSAYLRLEDKTMSISEGGEINHSPIRRRTHITLNSLMHESPLYTLSLVHEVAHASRSVTFRGRLERFWNYSFVKNEEGHSFSAEYKVLQRLLNAFGEVVKESSRDEVFNAIEKELNNRYIFGVHINKHRANWYKQGWINEKGNLTAKSVLMIQMLSLQPIDQLATRISADPILQSFLVHTYDLTFLDKLSLANKLTEQDYVANNLENYEGTVQKHRLMIATVHLNGLIASSFSLVELFK